MSRRSAFIKKVAGLARKYHGKGCLYLYSVDLADFKLINYIYGFAQGDELLQDVVTFVRGFPECLCCERGASDHFIFVVLTKQPRTDEEIMHAMDEGRFLFYLQPQVDIETGEIVGAEALARQRGENGEILGPNAFVPILEKNHKIVNLDYMVLEQVCQHLRARLDRGEPVVHTSINLSRQHIWNLQTADHLHAVVSKYQIPPELIMFELTENILITEFRGAEVLSERLRAWGYGTSIDDFGSGYAGIDIWRHLPFNELKLDKVFLDDTPGQNKKDEVIIRGLIWIAKNLNTTVICEGVERADQCRDLLDMHCQYAQGYYFSKPVPPDEFYERYSELHGHYPMTYKNAKS